MRNILTLLLVLASCMASGQGTVQKEINYVRSFRQNADTTIVELGNTPKLCFLLKSAADYSKYATLIKKYEQRDNYTNRKLFEIGVDKSTGQIKSIRSLNQNEEEQYKHLLPDLGLAAAAVAVDEDEATSYYNQALDLFNEKKYEESIRIINKSIAINTNNIDYHKLKAYCLGHLKRYRESNDEVSFSLEMDLSDAELYEIMANNYYFMGDYANACKSYEKSIEYEQNNETRIYHNYVRCLIEMPNPQRAVGVYKLYQYRIEGLTPYEDETGSFGDDLIFYTGQAYQQLGDFEKARTIYSRLIVMDPDFYGYYAQRGRLYQQKGDWIDAIRDFESALQIDSTQTILLTNLAQVYTELQDFRKAEDAYKKYLVQNPNDAVQMSNYGYLLLDEQRTKDAQQMFNKSFEIDNKSIDTHIGRILAAHLLGERKKKKEFIELAKRQFPEISINTTTLNALIKTGNYYYSDKVIHIWEDAIN